MALGVQGCGGLGVSGFLGLRGVGTYNFGV